MATKAMAAPKAGERPHLCLGGHRPRGAGSKASPGRRTSAWRARSCAARASTRSRSRRKPLVPANRKQKITAKDIAVFSRQLATMMAPGCPWSSPSTSSGAATPTLHAGTHPVHQGRRRGRHSLYDCAAQAPAVFRRPVLQPGAAGEQAGVLESCSTRSRPTRRRPSRSRARSRRPCSIPRR